MFLADLEQMEFIDPTLRAVLNWMQSRFGLGFVITSLYRIPEPGKKPGVHNTLPLRGADLRCHCAVVGKEIKTETNLHWKYDPKRPTKKVVRSHDVGLGFHIHVQVHPNTIEV